jgi:hypothetical protein
MLIPHLGLISNSKTFDSVTVSGQVKEVPVDNDIVDQSIKNSISRQLENMEWKETTESRGVKLDYNIMVEEKGSLPNYYYNRCHHRLGYIYSLFKLMGYHTRNIPFKEGVLTIDMIVAKTNKLICQGSAQDYVSGKTVTTQERPADVKSISKIQLS